MEAQIANRVQGFIPIGFPGYEEVLVQQTTTVFANELGAVRVSLPGLDSFLISYSPFAAKLRRKDVSAVALSSAAYPECSEVVFYTDLIRHHLPPHNVWDPDDSIDVYPVIENLIHESIHHWWGKQMNCLSEASNWSAQQTEVQVSWRTENWSLDKAMHAAWVYLAANELRSLFAPKYQESANRAVTEILSNEITKSWMQANLARELRSVVDSSLKDPRQAHFLKHLEIIL